MSKWTDVIEAQRRWADRLARTNGRFPPTPPARPSRLLRAYFRTLSILGRALVSLGFRLQQRYEPRPAGGDARLPIEH